MPNTSIGRGNGRAAGIFTGDGWGMRSLAAALTVASVAVLGTSSARGAITLDFTGGVVTYTGGGTFLPTNTTLSSGIVDYYIEDGYRFDFIGTPGAQTIGYYYGDGPANSVLHGHYEPSVTELRVSRVDGTSFNLDSFTLTSNTSYGGGAATGTELLPIRASYDGVTVGHSQFLPPEDWGLTTTKQILLGTEFDTIRYFSIIPNNTIYCFGMDNVVVQSVPEPTTAWMIVIGLGAVAACRRKHRRIA